MVTVQYSKYHCKDITTPSMITTMKIRALHKINDKVKDDDNKINKQSNDHYKLHKDNNGTCNLMTTTVTTTTKMMGAKSLNTVITTMTTTMEKRGRAYFSTLITD